MKRKLLVLSALMLLFSAAYSQKYVTKNGFIRFYSHTPIEDIEARNKAVNAALDAGTGDFVFKVLMKSFEFEKALMQEHFNENYVESDKFPNASFQGKVVNIKDVNFARDGSYPVTVEGNLTIHGVTKKVSEKGSLEVKGGKVAGKAKFNVKPADYDIRIPATVAKNIAESIEVTVDVAMDKLAK